MSKFVLVENGIVTQSQPNNEEGFISAPNYVIVGYTYDGQDFSFPEVSINTLRERVAEKIKSAMNSRIVDGVKWRYNGGDTLKPVRITPNMRSFLADTQAAIEHPSMPRPDVHGGEVWQDGVTFSIDDAGIVELAVFAYAWGLKISQIAQAETASLNGLTVAQLIVYDTDAIDWTVTWLPADAANGWSDDTVKQTP